MKIIIIGADGQLGKALQKKAIPNYEIIALNMDQCDVRDADTVTNELLKYKPEVVIHCGAYTAVDKAEVESTICEDININGTTNVALACSIIDAKLVFLSTDYVFDGTGFMEYEVDARVNPLSVYGRSKAFAEIEVQKIVKKHFVIRTSWMFGDGQNFVNTMIRLGKEKDIVEVVDDQIGAPTYSEDLAVIIYQVIKTENYGTYHITNEGECSWADLAEEVFQIMNMGTRIRRISSEEYPSIAKRPKNSRLSKKSLDLNGFSRLPTWQDALRRYLDEYGRSTIE